MHKIKCLRKTKGGLIFVCDDCNRIIFEKNK